MNVISALIARILQFFIDRSNRPRDPSVDGEVGRSVREDRAVSKPRNFDADYREATNMLKTRLGNRFPDNYQARVGSQANSTRDFGDERAEAIDTASAAIAEALRNGATPRQAAAAGANSIGI